MADFITLPEYQCIVAESSNTLYNNINAEAALELYMKYLKFAYKYQYRNITSKHGYFLRYDTCIEVFKACYNIYSYVKVPVMQMYSDRIDSFIESNDFLNAG